MGGHIIPHTHTHTHFLGRRRTRNSQCRRVLSEHYIQIEALCPSKTDKGRSCASYSLSGDGWPLNIPCRHSPSHRKMCRAYDGVSVSLGQLPGVSPYPASSSPCGCTLQGSVSGGVLYKVTVPCVLPRVGADRRVTVPGVLRPVWVFSAGVSQWRCPV